MTFFSLCHWALSWRAFSAQLGELLFELGEALLAGGVLLFLQRLPLHLALHDLALDDVDLRGHGIELDLEARGGFVHEIDGLVGQKAVADVAVRKRGGGDERAVLDAHAVVHFVALLEPAQDGDGVLDARLIDHHRLEAALERGVLLDVFAVFVERGRADGAQFAARELRLEHVAGVDRAFARARRRRWCAARR